MGPGPCPCLIFYHQYIRIHWSQSQSDAVRKTTRHDRGSTTHLDPDVSFEKLFFLLLICVWFLFNMVLDYQPQQYQRQFTNHLLIAIRAQMNICKLDFIGFLLCKWIMSTKLSHSNESAHTEVLHPLRKDYCSMHRKMIFQESRNLCE